MRFFLLFSFFLIFSLSPVHAGEVLYCGDPAIGLEGVEPHDPDTHNVCDIYTRQLEYRKERLKFRKQLEDRQKNYIKAYNEAVQNYHRELDKLYGY